MFDPRATADLTYTRTFNAPRALIFRCMTRPEHLTHFWGPAGTTTPVDAIIVDLRPGGTFETTMINDADGTRHVSRAEYLEVVEPDRLVWIDRDHGTTTTVVFVDLDGERSDVHIRQTAAPKAFHTPRARAGFATSLDRLDHYLTTLNPTHPTTNLRRPPWT